MSARVELQKASLRLGENRFAFDLDVPAGALAIVTGASGAGKTTLFNIISGFETPDSGEVRIGGNPMTGLTPAKRPISLVFQDHNLFAHMNIASNIGLGINARLKLSQSDWREVSAALDKVGLSHFEKRLPGTLSGGERQRAAFARALVQKRPVILLDEPFAALDPALRKEMGTLLETLWQETGATIMMISHDPGEVQRLATLEAHVDKGRISTINVLN